MVEYVVIVARLYQRAQGFSHDDGAEAMIARHQ
jgi:hypothetical protein